MSDIWSRTFTIPAGTSATTITLPAMPYGAGRMLVSKVGGSDDLWISVGTQPATVGGDNVLFIPAGEPERVIDIGGLLQRGQHRSTWQNWSFTVVYPAGGMVTFELLDPCGLEPTLN